MAKVTVKRSATDVSPKVSIPAILAAVAIVVQLIVSGGWNTPETVTALVALGELIVAYFAADKVEPDAQVVDGAVVVAEVGS